MRTAHSFIKMLAIILLASGTVVLGPKSTVVAQASPQGSLEGRVVDEVSGRPIPGAIVTLMRSRSRIRLSATTSTDGSFAFTSVAPDDYRLAASADHYVDQEYGQKAFWGDGKVISIRSGERGRAIEVRLGRTGTISGTVLDERGVAVPQATVRIYRRVGPARDDGNWRIDPVGIPVRGSDYVIEQPISVQTDRLGRYRLEDLKPEDYFVVVFRNPNALNYGVAPGGATGEPCNPARFSARGRAERYRDAVVPAGDSPPQEVDLPSLYPGTSDPMKAVPVHVSANDEIQGIDFKLRLTPTAKLTGTVTLPAESASDPTTCINIAVVPIGPRASLQIRHALLTLIGARTFQFSALIPGTYAMAAVSGPPDKGMLAVQTIDVQPGSSQTIALALKRGFDVSGQVILGSPPPQGFSLDKLSMRILSVADGSGLLNDLNHYGLSSSQFPVNPDGSFVLHNVQPEMAYLFGFPGMNLSKFQLYLAAVRYGDSESPDGRTLALKNGPDRLAIKLGSGLGTVETVVTDQGKARPEAMTVLFRKGLIGQNSAPRTLSDSQGRAVFTDIEPGDYEVYAWEDVTPERWAYWQFMEQFKGRGRAVHVGSGATSTVEVPMIRAERSLP